MNVSSQASKAALKDHAVYCATKAALDSLTGVMGLELGPHEVNKIFHDLNCSRYYKLRVHVNGSTCSSLFNLLETTRVPLTGRVIC